MRGFKIKKYAWHKRFVFEFIGGVKNIKIFRAICIGITGLVLIACIPTFLAHQIYETTNTENNMIESILKSMEKQSYSRNEEHGEQLSQTDLTNSLLLELRRSFMAKKISDQKLYKVGFSTQFLEGNCALLKLNHWITGILLKGVPCLLLLCFTFALLIRLRANECKRKLLLSKNFENKSISPMCSLITSNSKEKLNGSTKNELWPLPSQIVPLHSATSIDSTKKAKKCSFTGSLKEKSLTISSAQLVTDSNSASNLENDVQYIITKKVNKPIFNTVYLSQFIENVKHQKLFTSTHLSIKSARFNRRSSTYSRYSRTVDRTTYVLLLMLTIFLLTELPQGIFAMLNGVFAYKFHGYVYMAIADVLDLLSLINCHVAFAVYMCTSSTYRQTLSYILASILNKNLKTKQLVQQSGSKTSMNC